MILVTKFVVLLVGFAVEYTDMAKHARKVMEANGVEDVVTVIQGAVEEIDLPIEEDNLEAEDPEHPDRVVDIFISEWMGYFLLRERCWIPSSELVTSS